MMNSERVHAALDSHISVLHISSDPHDARVEPRNFELNELKSEREGPSATLLLDDRLHPTDIRDPQERAKKIAGNVPAPPAKKRATPPPSLTLAIPELQHAGNEWHVAPPLSGLSGVCSATRIQSDYSGTGAGYFSPPQSPDASPSTSVQPSSSHSTSTSFVKRTRLRSRTVANVDFAKFSASKNRGVPKMVKERRSLQSLLRSSILQSLQPQTTPLGLVPGTRIEAPSVPAQGAASSVTSGSGENGTRTERRRSFYTRRRSRTYSGRDNALSSPSVASPSIRVPPMPEGYPPLITDLPTAGRESPSSYLLDDDPFAVVSSPTLVAPPVNSPIHSPGYTPMPSPACSIAHSRSPSTVSLSSASSTSMPGTPVLHTFDSLSEEAEGEVTSPTSAASAPSSAVSLQSTPVPSPPPPTPASPLNPNSTPVGSTSERAKSKERMLRSPSASSSTTPLPTLAYLHPHPSSSSPLSASQQEARISLPPPARARPAHTRPAFVSRPSLPSLTTLSRMGTAAGELAGTLRGRKRRGKVGAGLPAEPWDLPSRDASPARQMNEEENDRVEGEVMGKPDDEGRIACQATTSERDEEREEDSAGALITSVRDDLHFRSCSQEPEAESIGQLDEERVAYPPASNIVEDVGTPRILPSTIVRISDENITPSIDNLNLDKLEAEENESALEVAAGSEDANEKVENLAGNAHGEGGISIDADLSYMTRFSTSSQALEVTNGESAASTAMVATLSDITPLSDEREDRRAERDADQEVDEPAEGNNSFNYGDESDGGENYDDLTAAASEPRLSQVNVGLSSIDIPRRVSAIPRHVLWALTPYPFAASRSASPSFSNASWSPQSSVEDFGVLLSSSPAFSGDQRPESLTIDPGLPGASAHYEASVDDPTFAGGENHLNHKDGTSSSPSSSAPLPASLPSLIAREGGDPEIEAAAETTEANIDLGSTSDGVFAREAEGLAESPPTRRYATVSQTTPLFPQQSILSSSPIAPYSRRDGRSCPLSPLPIREDGPSVDYASSEHRSLSPQQVENYAHYYPDSDDYEVEHEQRGHLIVEKDDSSMLPPLSTLPEEDPVFTLMPARSQERYERSEFGSLSSRSVSRKASVATIASIFSMRSGSSGCASQNSHTYSRTHSPAASLSTTLPISNSQTSYGSGSFVGKRMYGSSSGSADSGHGHAPSSSVSSLRSKSSMDLRGLANMRRHGSQSSGISMHTLSSTRTKFDPHGEAHGLKKSSVEDVMLGLRPYTGSSYAAAVQVELEGKASKYELPSTARYGDDELIADIKREDVAPGPGGVMSPEGKSCDSKAVGLDTFEPGSSAGTLRPPTQQQETERVGSRSPSESNKHFENQSISSAMLARTHTNGYNYSYGRDGGEKDWGHSGGYGTANGNGYYGDRNGSSRSEYNGIRRGAERRGRGNSREDDEKSSRRPSAYSPPTTSESESESESESDTDDYGEESSGIVRSTNSYAPAVRAPPAPATVQEEPPIFSQLRNGRKGVYKPPSAISTDNTSREHTTATEDDDVPLAQRIPGALQAQKSIRQQVRSERERWRRERSVAPTPRTSRAPEGTISPPPQHVPGISQDERGRIRMPRSAPLGGGAAPLSSSQEAAMMAQQMLQPHHATHAVHRPRAKTLSGADRPGVPPDVLMKRLLKVQARDQDAPMPEQRATAVSPVQPPMSAQSFEKSPIERTSGAHSMTRLTVSPQYPLHHVEPHHADPPIPARTLRPMRSFHGVAREPSSTSSAPAPPVPALATRRRSPSRPRQAHDASIAPDSLTRNKSIKNTRRNEEDAHMLRAQSPHSGLHNQTIPPVPSRGPSPPPKPRHNLVQIRVYINDMQRFNVVEAALDTSAKDVLDMLRQQGDLRGEERRSSSWMLYEVCQDFGMERPVRNFELVLDISGSWNKEKSMNCFMVKPSPFARCLASIPSSIPTRSGFVDYESKKAKWSKRWLELREHGLWLSKREGKDDEFLCSLSAFDGYVVTRIHKATKNFTFAVKSTDPITLFENKADYLHVFSVPEDTGIAWLEAIWLARSYILYQEKNVLFRNKTAGESGNAGANLARSGTRKKPAQTYITLAQPKALGAAESTGPFEPGSLLAKRAIS